MASYSIQINNQNSTTTETTLPRSTVQVSSTVPTYYVVGSDTPTATDRCAVIAAGQTLTLRLPVKCLRIAFLAVNQPGLVTIVEINGTKASCSA
jgi:hypothetical protein